MKRSAPLSRSRKRIARRSRPRAKGGSLFPKRRDPKYWAWCGEQVKRGVPCDGCGRGRANVRAHLKPRSTGGYDRNNIAFLGSGPGSCECDQRSEKRVDRFIAEGGRNLYGAARDHTIDYLTAKTRRFVEMNIFPASVPPEGSP